MRRFRILPCFPALLLPLLGLLLLPCAAAAASGANRLPDELGRVVYRQNPTSPVQIFIVADSHRSAVTGANGKVTVEAQLETFRIGQWLIGQRQVDLLLPEGYFGQTPETPPPAAPGLPDTATLQARLADPANFVNAELLLHRHFGIPMRQVEDRGLYRRTRQWLRDGLGGSALLSPGYARTLDYLQRRRLAAILQQAPTAIEAAFQQGRIATPRAMLTIGLAHLEDLVQTLRRGAIHIPAPQPDNAALPPLDEVLQLAHRNCGVAVIVPAALCSRAAVLAAAVPTAE